MDKKINLDDILNKYSSNGIVNDNPRAIVTAEEARLSMMDFAKQLLELAHENAEVVVDTCMGHKTGEVWVDKESIMKTLEQVTYE